MSMHPISPSFLRATKPHIFLGQFYGASPALAPVAETLNYAVTWLEAAVISHREYPANDDTRFLEECELCLFKCLHCLGELLDTKKTRPN